MTRMPLTPAEVGYLQTFMQTLAAMYAIVFVVYQIQWGHFSSKPLDVQIRDGPRYHRSFSRVAFWGGHVVATIGFCGLALVYDSSDFGVLGTFFFFYTLVAMGYIMIAEAYSSAMASLYPWAATLALREYVQRHPEAAPTLVEGDRETLANAVFDEPGVIEAVGKKIEHEARPWAARKVVEWWRRRRRTEPTTKADP
jgi:hypothetical protein